MSVHKPKISVVKLRSEHRKQITKVSKKNPVYERLMTERHNKEVAQLKDRGRKYRKQQTIKRTSKRTETKLFEKTKKTLKGHSQKEINKIWISYQSRKKTITKKKVTALDNLFNKLAYSKISEYGQKYSNSEFYSIDGNEPTDVILGLFDDIKHRHTKPRYILIILNGHHKITHEKLYLSDSFSYDQLNELLHDFHIATSTNEYFDFIEYMTDMLFTKDTGENFVLDNYDIKLIYNIND